MNYWYEVHQVENDDNCLTKHEAVAKAEAFIDGVKFARAE